MNDHAAWIKVDGSEVECGGRWTMRRLDSLERRLIGLTWPEQTEITWQTKGIEAMDSGGAWLLDRTVNSLRRSGRRVRIAGLSTDHAALMEIIARHRPSTPLRAEPRYPAGLEAVGRWAWDQVPGISNAVAFLGESATVAATLLSHPGLIRWRSFWRNTHVDGFNALPITGLLMFLMGIVIAYQGAEQLRIVGANIYIVELVGISILREIAPLVTAIIVAGRSGSAYAAQIGSMKVTEELDAVRALGISPMMLLVLPRLMALILVMPLLTVYADLLGVLGGMIIAKQSLGVGFSPFVARFARTIAMKHYLIGIGKAPFFAMAIALVGCYQGFQIRGGVESVGKNTTSSVVKSIFLVIVIDAFFSVLFSWWDI